MILRPQSSGVLVVKLVSCSSPVYSSVGCSGRRLIYLDHFHDLRSAPRFSLGPQLLVTGFWLSVQFWFGYESSDNSTRIVVIWLIRALNHLGGVLVQGLRFSGRCRMRFRVGVERL